MDSIDEIPKNLLCVGQILLPHSCNALVVLTLVIEWAEVRILTVGGAVPRYQTAVWVKCKVHP
jgi:hypothetical protein